MEWGGDKMSPHLFDPVSPPANIWPQGQADVRAYIEGIAQHGPTHMAENVSAKWRALRSGGRVFPVTINDGEVGGSYVCLPHSAYILYAREELDLVDIGLLAPFMRGLIKLASPLLLGAGINKIVQLDNWLLSTNLHGDWAGEDISQIRTYLMAKYPKHILALRSLDDWSCPKLLSVCKDDGWVLLPSRQIWVTDDMKAEWTPRHSSKNDKRHFNKAKLSIEDITIMTTPDAERIAQLYYMLYVGKYSPLNPVFTPAYIKMTCEAGLFSYRCARDESGTIMAVSGALIRGDILTPPVVGYDTDRPQKEGLYRIACYLFNQQAMTQGLRVNGSAGAASFKRHRGAHARIEYSAFYVGHLPLRRRAVIKTLAVLLNRLAVPMMKRKQL